MSEVPPTLCLAAGGGTVRIDCDECAKQGTDQCKDCVVTFVLDREEGPLVVDAEEARALRALGEAGLVPLLKLTPRKRAG
jgi:hypothetical protein